MSAESPSNISRSHSEVISKNSSSVKRALIKRPKQKRVNDIKRGASQELAPMGVLAQVSAHVGASADGGPRSSVRARRMKVL